MSVEIKKSVEIFDDYESRPVPEEKRNRWVEQGAVWLGAGFCLPAFAVGGQLAMGLGFWQAVLAIVLGSAILALVASLVGAIGATTHLSAAMTSRFTFGKNGASIFGIILAVCSFGWFGYQCSFFGQSAVSIVEMSTGAVISETLCVILGGLAMMVTAIVGFKGIKILSNFGVPLLFILVFSAIVKTFSTVSIGDIVSSSAISDPISIATGISMVIGSFAVGVCIVPDFTRYSKTIADSTKGCLLGYFFGYIAIVLSGAIFAYAFSVNDFTDVLINMLGFGYFAAVILIIATWTTNDNNLYQSVLGLANCLEGRVKVARWKITVVAGICATAFGALGVVNIFIPFLSLLCVLIPPFAATMIVDFYVGNKDGYKFEDMDGLAGFRKTSCVSTLVGCLVGLSMNSAPVGFGVPFMVKLSGFVPSSIVAMLAAIVAYLVISKVVKK